MGIKTFQDLPPEQVQQYAERATRFALDELLKLLRHITTLALSITLAVNAFVVSVLPDAEYQWLLIVSSLLMLFTVYFAIHMYYVVMKAIWIQASDGQRSMNMLPILDLVFRHREDQREANTKDIVQRMGINMVLMRWSFAIGILTVVAFVVANAISLS
jgi:hypothetical protein